MVKFIAENKDTGRIILGLGITHGNILKLKQDHPIHFDAEQLGLPRLEVHEIVIFYGETEEQIQKDFIAKGIVTADRVKIDKGDKH